MEWVIQITSKRCTIKEMVQIYMWFESLWVLILIHSSRNVLNSHALITKEGGLPHNTSLAFG
jgi:hypothetical protein